MGNTVEHIITLDESIAESVQQLLSLVEHEAGDSESAGELIAATLDYVETNLPDDNLQ